MNSTIHIITVVITTFLLNCSSQSNQISKASIGDTITPQKTLEPIDTTRVFVKNYGIKNNNPLFVFVGEKISVEPLPHEQGSMDNGFRAKYAVLDRVFGDFPVDTIEFVAYDHYGTPPFSMFKHVLLYVSADSGIYYHQKYMYNDVYKTRDGRWAGTYAARDYGHDYNKHTRVKPIKIEFAEKVAYPTKKIDEEGQQITFSYPKPYFKTVGDSAIAIYGNHIEDLFILKRDGYLTAREIFKNGKLVQ